MRRGKRKKAESYYFEFDELITRVLCDSIPKGKVDVAYLFAETSDNEASVLKAGYFLYKFGPARRLAISLLKRGYGYPGFENWRRKILKMGVASKDLFGVPEARDFPPSTSAEALGFVRFAKMKKWKTAYIVAPPLHQLRAFITTVSSVIKEKSNLKVYSFPGTAQNWLEHVVHSQGILRGSRHALIRNELQKIERYRKKGDLISAREVLDYLNKRDRK